MCDEFIWGIANKQGYQCQNCKRSVHEKCINRCFDVCKGVSELYSVPDNQLKVSAKCDLIYKTNYRLNRHDNHTGKPILPFTKMYKCQRCVKNRVKKSGFLTLSDRTGAPRGHSIFIEDSIPKFYDTFSGVLHLIFRISPLPEKSQIPVFGSFLN